MVFYQIMIGSLTELPLLVSISITVLELIFLSYHLLVVSKYRYPKEWMIFYSILNTSCLNLVILSIIDYSIIMNSPPSEYVQINIIIIIIISITVQSLIMVVRIVLMIVHIVRKLWSRYKNKKNDDPSESFYFKYFWIPSPRLSYYIMNLPHKKINLLKLKSAPRKKVHGLFKFRSHKIKTLEKTDIIA